MMMIAKKKFPTNCFPFGLRGSRQSLWGGAEDILNFGGGVSLEGSLSSDSRDELSSETMTGLLVAVVLGAFSRRGQTLRT